MNDLFDENTAGETITPAALLPNAQDAGLSATPIPTPDPLAAYDAAIEKLRNATLSVEEYRAAYTATLAQRENLLARLNKFTKQDLLKRVGTGTALRYGREDKKRLVTATYEDMLSGFTLGRMLHIGVCSGGEEHRQLAAKALERMVVETTQEALTAYGKAYLEDRRLKEEQRQSLERAHTDPQTLQDFYNLIKQKGEGALTIGQVARYDELSSVDRLEYFKRLQVERTQERARLRYVSCRVGARIIPTRHTKKLHDLWAVKLEQRVEKSAFRDLCRLAARLEGYYSRYHFNGAVSGFQFKAPEHAQAFHAVVTQGDYSAATAIARQIQSAYEDDLEQSTVERLRTMAERLERLATEKRDQERKTNTVRRVRMADSVEARARADIALARTMCAIAAAIESGSAMYLGDLRTKVQVELLESLLDEAQQAQVAAKMQQELSCRLDWQEVRQRCLAVAPDAETALYLRFPYYELHRSTLGHLGRQLAVARGAKSLSQSLLKLGDDVTPAFIKFVKDNLERVVATVVGAPERMAVYASLEAADAARRRSPGGERLAVVTLGRGKHYLVANPELCKARDLWPGQEDKALRIGPKFIEEMMDKVEAHNDRVEEACERIELPYHLEYLRAKRERLRAMGLDQARLLRAALREFVQLRTQPEQQDRITALMRDLVGRAGIGVDFFPTSKSVAGMVVDLAQITPDMDVCEPSAGYGALADEIRERDVEPKVCETSITLQQILEAKGYEVVGMDFLEYQGFHDCFVMNPPFSADVEHVMHAYAHLNPGGRIVAIVNNALFHNSDKRSQGFRQWLDTVGGTEEKLPSGSFMDPALVVTTAVSARVVTIRR